MSELKTPLIENHDRAYDANRVEVRMHLLVEEYNALVAENERLTNGLVWIDQAIQAADQCGRVSSIDLATWLRGLGKILNNNANT